jgi:TolA-binding protein
MTRPKVESRLAAEELAIRARRGELSAEQQALLQATLDSSASLRLTYQVGCDFDDVQRVRAGDDELIVRASERALHLPRRRDEPKRAALPLLAAAVLLAATGAAAAGVLVAWPAASKWTATSSVMVPAPHMTRAHTRGGAGRAGRVTQPPASEQPSTASPSEAAKAPRSERDTAATPSPLGHDANGAASPRPVARKASDPPAAMSAASMFREANAARRLGDLGGAKALYAALQAAFPNSNEARVSRVSLGKLHLSSGSPSEAERQFQLYLASGGGHLSEEALVGRAEALGRLGNTDEELRVWQRLRAQHPNSLYEARARARVQELNAGGREQSNVWRDPNDSGQATP